MTERDVFFLVMVVIAAGSLVSWLVSARQVWGRSRREADEPPRGGPLPDDDDSDDDGLGRTGEKR